MTSIVSKAKRALGMIKRNINVAPMQAKSQAYQTLVRPHLEYCSSVWDPHTQTDVNRIEAVQRRAARFCFRRYTRRSSPTLMQADLGWSLLSARREQARLIGPTYVQTMSLPRKCELLQNPHPNYPTNAPFPPIYVSETCSCQQLPQAFFLPNNNSPMEQPARHPGMRTHRGCIQLCFKDR